MLVSDRPAEAYSFESFHPATTTLPLTAWLVSLCVVLLSSVPVLWSGVLTWTSWARVTRLMELRSRHRHSNRNAARAQHSENVSSILPKRGALRSSGAADGIVELANGPH